MKGYISGIDWLNIEPMKYWSFTASTAPDVRRDTIRNAVFSGDYIGALKVDGYYERIIKDEDGNCFMAARSRNVNGEIVNKLAWLPQIQPWLEKLPNGTCLLCECYWPNNEGSKKITSILGCLAEKAIKRQEKAPLHLYVFDCMALAGENFDKAPYIERAKQVGRISKIYQDKYVEYAKYFEGKELWDHLQAYLASGREGMVIMRKDAIVYQKRTPARVSIKVKKEIQQVIDCFFTGEATPPTREYTGKEVEKWPYWENQVSGEKIQGEFYREFCLGKPIRPVTKNYFHGWAGSMQIAVFKKAAGKSCYFNGKEYKDHIIVPIGWLSGITEEMRADPHKFAYKPIAVTAMEIDFDGKTYTLRHGKIDHWRDDIPVEDCGWEKI